MKISEEKIVSITYDLNVGEGDERELMEKATKDRPLTFLFGMGMMLESFEKNLEGLQNGDKFSFSLKPEDAYGSFEQDRIVELPKNVFEIEGKFDDERIRPGEVIPMMDAEGNRLNGAVVELKNDSVIMDFNHPLAGETLHFEGEIIDVHEPTPEEIAAITSGGCSGCNNEQDHDNCGCDCGCH